MELGQRAVSKSGYPSGFSCQQSHSFLFTVRIVHEGRCCALLIVERRRAGSVSDGGMDSMRPSAHLSLLEAKFLT